MLKKLSFLIVISFFSVVKIDASENCFIAKENAQIIKEVQNNSNNAHLQHSPYSTFKVIISLIGFQEGILQSSSKPTFAFSEDKGSWHDPHRLAVQMYWDRDHTPKSWIKYSVVWVSQEITKKLGFEKFESYVKKLVYGNQDVSGTQGQNNGLTRSWINSSLRISPLEQVEFMEKLSNRSLPFSKEAQENTIQLIELENIGDDWKLYGKTGGGKIGWFVGWIEKDDRRIVFAQYLVANDSPITAGRLAKEVAKDNLISLMLSPPTYNLK